VNFTFYLLHHPSNEHHHKFFLCSLIINLYMIMFHVSLVSLIQFFPYKALPLPIVIL